MVASRLRIVGQIGKQNRENCYRLCDRLGLDRGLADGEFVAGSMFWCRTWVLQALNNAGLRQDEFEEGYAADGTLAHAVERVLGAIARSRGILYGR